MIYTYTSRLLPVGVEKGERLGTDTRLWKHFDVKNYCTDFQNCFIILLHKESFKSCSYLLVNYGKHISYMKKFVH